jgi:formylglycine-generating enzyme required for sulfatase activity
VVPLDGGRLAVAKFETSWLQLAPFCAETQACPVREVELPVANVTVDLAVQYAQWLTERTGARYRLPTIAEWRLYAAAGEPDPNRNCGRPKFLWWGGKSPVDVRAGAENDLGVVNALGNAREWAWDGEALVAAGGSYRDPPEQCVAEHLDAHDGTADPLTGFRLVREVR